MITLNFRVPIDLEDADAKAVEVDLLVDIMWDAGFCISGYDAYLAWLMSNDGVWENPLDYDEDDVVDEILAWTCSDCVWPEESVEDYGWDDPTAMPFFEEWLDSEMDGYEPKVNAHVEGYEYEDDSGTDRS